MNIRKCVSIKSRRFVLGVVLGLISLIFIFAVSRNLKAGVVFGLLFAISGCIKIHEEDLSDKWNSILFCIWFFISAFVTLFLSQFVLSEMFTTVGIQRVILGAIICEVLFLVIFTITLKPVHSISIVSASLVFLTAVNHFVYEFRGSEINPSDTLSIQTAGNVAAEYKIVFTNPIYYGFVLTVIYIFLSFGLPKFKDIGKIKTRVISLLLICVLIITYIPISENVEPQHYKNFGSSLNGFILNYTLQLREAFVSKPEGYSMEMINDLASHYRNESTITKATDDIPDIIVIMDESFADLSVLGFDLRTNQEVTPFIDSLYKNTIRGYSLSSVYGGGTPNSEYEFLTGNSMFFLPTGSIAYQQYLKRPSYSMVGELKENGYKCISMHPFLSNGWARTVVYPYLGFDESYFIEDFSADNLIREYVSDYEMFEKLIELYEENKVVNKDLFMFGVTMQNHGGYNYTGSNYEQTITLDGYSQDYDDAEQYLTLIHETDSAIKYLINYFEGVDDNVVLLFYGDHLPKLNNSFYEEIHGGKFKTLDEQQLEYIVPFFIWTNYDIEEESVELTSFNYLSNYVYNAAGLTLPEYNELLADIQGIVPALNANGYYSYSKKCFVNYEEASGDEKEALSLYWQLEYNNMFDYNNHNEIFFPIYEK